MPHINGATNTSTPVKDVIPNTMQPQTPAQHSQKMMARALYDNYADTLEELAFKKGDILTVIEQDTDGMKGWWLCTLRNRKGICPGNRLRLITSHDSGFFTSSTSSPRSSIRTQSGMSVGSSQGTFSELYDLNEELQNELKYGRRRPYNSSPNMVLTPKRCGEVFTYDFLSPTESHQNNSLYQNQSVMSNSSDAYDIPKPSSQMSFYDTPRIHRQQDNSYDIPRPSATLIAQQLLTPSSSNSSLLTSDSLSLSSSNRSSLIMPDYDVPRRNPPSVRNMAMLNPPTLYDSPISSHKKQLPLPLNSALDTLDRLQSETQISVSKLLGFVNPHWRLPGRLDIILLDFNLIAVRLKTSLHNLTEFSEGALANAADAEDKTLVTKLKPLVKALRDTDKLIQSTMHNIDIDGWTIESLSRTDSTKSNPRLDSLDQLIACAQTLTEDVRRIAAFIQGNAPIIFKPEQFLKKANESDDYDYVSLGSNNLGGIYTAINDKSTADLQVKFSSLMRPKESAAEKMDVSSVDKALLIYYTRQAVLYIGYLNHSIESFLETVTQNQPPKFFLAYGKFVVLSAHNLVSIGDMVHRNISNKIIKERVLQCADALCDALKSCVAKTKKANQYFPSVQAVQEMVDSIVDISQSAIQLKITLLQAIQ